MNGYKLEIINIDSGIEYDTPSNFKTVIRLVQRTEERGFYALGWLHSKESFEHISKHSKNYLDKILEQIKIDTEVVVIDNP